MTKCDFCICYYNGKCYCDNAIYARSDCERAIKLMVETLKAMKK